MKKEDFNRIAKVISEGKRAFESYPPDCGACVDAFEYLLVHFVREFQGEKEFDEGSFVSTVMG